MQLSEFNLLDEPDALAAVFACCASERWASQLVKHRPYSGIDQLQAQALNAWQSLQEEDYLQAFDGHPKIGDPASLKKKYAATHATASAEQSGMLQASDQTIAELAELNARYENQFGFIFIVCATGKTAEQMLTIIRQRVDNARAVEIGIAAKEQSRITAIRLNKLFGLNT